MTAVAKTPRQPAPTGKRPGSAPSNRLSHVDRSGRPRMVDVSGKAESLREAVASGSIAVSAPALRLLRAGKTGKGDALQVARLAGIMAAKKTSELIPLCHPLPLSHVDIDILPAHGGYEIEARVRTNAATGVEMEALTAVAVAALTIYDMVKAVDREMVIGDIRLMEKRGGRSGQYVRGTGGPRRTARSAGDV
jgi:cyclic pyranopterin monophosphate synthase